MENITTELLSLIKVCSNTPSYFPTMEEIKKETRLEFPHVYNKYYEALECISQINEEPEKYESLHMSAILDIISIEYLFALCKASIQLLPKILDEPDFKSCPKLGHNDIFNLFCIIPSIAKQIVQLFAPTYLIDNIIESIENKDKDKFSSLVLRVDLTPMSIACSSMMDPLYPLLALKLDKNQLDDNIVAITENILQKIDNINNSAPHKEVYEKLKSTSAKQLKEFIDAQNECTPESSEIFYKLISDNIERYYGLVCSYKPLETVFGNEVRRCIVDILSQANNYFSFEEAEQKYLQEYPNVIVIDRLHLTPPKDLSLDRLKELYKAMNTDNWIDSNSDYANFKFVFGLSGDNKPDEFKPIKWTKASTHGPSLPKLTKLLYKLNLLSKGEKSTQIVKILNNCFDLGKKIESKNINGKGCNFTESDDDVDKFIYELGWKGYHYQIWTIAKK